VDAAGGLLPAIPWWSLVVCCAGLMLVLAGVGLMSLAWTAAVGVVILVQKVGPRPAMRSRGVAAE